MKTRTVRGREQHVKELEAVDEFTKCYMNINRLDVLLRYKLPDGKLRHILDYHTEVPSRHIESRFACVTSSTVKVAAFKKKYGVFE